MVKYIIDNLKSKDTLNLVCELIHIKAYYDNPLPFYHFFKLQGGTIHILASYILAYKNGLKLN